MSSINFTYTVSNELGIRLVDQFDNDGWKQIDTGELQVTQFTVDGSTDQVPWFFHTAASGNNVAYAYHSGIYTYASAPYILGFYSISYITDHYVVAKRGGTSSVFRWTGDAYGGGANAGWSYLSGSNDVPSGGQIVQIAYASAAPGTAVGTVGPSHLYMVDSNNWIYQWGELGAIAK
jgi:hypothetical protein